MGEAKRRAEQARRVHDALLQKFGDEGMVMEAGWASLKAVWLHPDSPPEQVKDLRWAFFAGAQHLYSALMNIMDPDEEPTAADMKRMEMIHVELEAFRHEMEASITTEGRA